MSKLWYKWYMLPMLLGISHTVFTQNYKIQLCGFVEAIQPSFFSYSGLEGVSHQINAYNFHEYQWGNYTTLKNAQLALKDFKTQPFLKDFKQLKIVHSIGNLADNSSSFEKNTARLSQETNFQLFSRHITFKNANLSLQPSEVAILEEITTILATNPDLKLRIFANQKELKKPGQAMPVDLIEHFILAQNIPAYRIKIMHSKKRQNLSKKQTVLLTLVDLKEEIVLDKFSSKSLFVKQAATPTSPKVLE